MTASADPAIHQTRLDVANGDADGLCALHQLRLAGEGGESLVTGVKRDIALLRRVEADAGDLVTVCDISLQTNREGLLRLLEHGARVRWFDHHDSGAIPQHPRFESHIDTQPGVCTSLLVDRYLGGRYRAWAVAAAFGDNLADTAARLAAPLGVDASALALLREVGESMNYNAYGETVEDLRLSPHALYRLIGPYADPLQCLAAEPVFAQLRRGRSDDLGRAQAIAPRLASAGCTATALPDAAWSRRVGGMLANRLAEGDPARAHAVLAPSAGGGYIVSVRAPKGDARGAAAFCREFPGGGGRHEAGGINRLAEDALPRFLERFEAWYR